MNYLIVPFVLLELLGNIGISQAGNLARGWGDNIEWSTLDAGFKLSEESHKPIMLIIHKTWCGACKSLKAKFSENSDIEEMSRAFVMVNVEDDEEPSDPKYQPDGGYIPRILFIDSAGKVHDEIINASADIKYKYFYYSTSDVLSSMKQAADTIKSKSHIGSDEF